MRAASSRALFRFRSLGAGPSDRRVAGSSKVASASTGKSAKNLLGSRSTFVFLNLLLALIGMILCLEVGPSVCQIGLCHWAI